MHMHSAHSQHVYILPEHWQGYILYMRNSDPVSCLFTKPQIHIASQLQCTMQERYYGEKLHLNIKDPASPRKVVEDFVQARPALSHTCNAASRRLCLPSGC